MGISSELQGAGSNAVLMRVERDYSFPPALVYEAWLTAKSAREWWFRTPTGALVTCEIEPKCGGAIRIVEKRGDLLTEHLGEFVVLERPERIVFDFAADPSHKPTRVTVEITPKSGGCKLALWHVMEPEWLPFLERARNGWLMILEGLAKSLSRSEI